jgi:hypothetical protein
MLSESLMRFRSASLTATVLTASFFPFTAPACEPIIPLTQLMSGANLTGPLLLVHSFVWLVIAVAIKTGSFVFMEHRLPPARALGLMLAANVLSTIPGFLTAILAGAFTLLALPVVFLLGKLAEKRFAALPSPEPIKRFLGNGLPFLFTALFLISVVMFYLAGTALDDSDFASYWMLKLFFATIAVSVGMGLSVVLEECAIATLARKAYGQLSFYTSVFRANYITLAVVLGVAAAQMIPRRIGEPNFIVSWLHSIASTLGLA